MIFKMKEEIDFSRGNIFETLDAYCPINIDGKCGGEEECNHERCYEKMHYKYPTKSYEQKMSEWREHRRREVRWKDKI